MRLALLLAIDEIHGGETAGPHINANTIVTDDEDRNAAIVGSYLLFDIVGQLRRPTGHAINALPLTEYQRVPSPEEVVQVQVLASQMVKEARRAADLVDFRPVKDLKNRIVRGGRLFRDRTLEKLKGLGINTTDPIEMMLALRRIGPWRLEQLAGLDERDRERGHPLVPSTMYQYALAEGDKVVQAVRSQGLSQVLAGQQMILASTDVHEYGKVIVGVALKEAGAQVVDLGVSIDARKVAESAARKRIDAICISTHNGMALNYAQDLLGEMGSRGVRVPVFIGGKLNQDVDGDLPKDVTEDLRELDIIPGNDVIGMIRALRGD
jgi:methylmalonyl-CoA mutase cobalamin-binding subunit